MKTNLILAGAATLMMTGAVAQAQMAAPATQAAPPTVTPAQPDAAAAPAQAAAPDAASAPTTTAAASDGVTKEGNRYVKDGRPATKVEIAAFKKASKTRSE